MIRSIKFAILPLIIGFLFSCSSTRTALEEENLEKVKDTEIKATLDSLSMLSFDYFYSRISTKYKDTAQNVSFKTSLRMVNDSAINTLITFARIPVANALITPDSVIVSNKRDKCFMAENLNFFRKQFGVDFNFENVEELFFGKPVDYDPNQEYFRIRDPKAYTFSSHRKKDIKRNERKDEREIVTYYTLTNDLSNLKQMQIVSPEDSTMFDIQYTERELIDGFMTPKIVNLTIYTPKQEITVDLDYRKTHVNRAEKIHFVIPESYEKCK